MSFGTIAAAESSLDVVEARQEVARLYCEFLLDRPETDIDVRAAEELLQEADRIDDIEGLATLKRVMRELFRPQWQAYP